MAKRERSKVEENEVRTQHWRYVVTIEADDVRTKEEAIRYVLGELAKLPRKPDPEAVEQGIVRIKRAGRASRYDRLAEAMDKVGEGISEVNCLKEELEEWRDNLPDSFRDGEKGQALEEAISQLEEIEHSLEDAQQGAGDVDFPGMY